MKYFQLSWTSWSFLSSFFFLSKALGFFHSFNNEEENSTYNKEVDNSTQEFKEFLPEEETFDELVPSDETKNILAESEDLQMPEFVKKLIEKKGRENVKMPYLIKKMLEKAGKLPKE